MNFRTSAALVAVLASVCLAACSDGRPTDKPRTVTATSFETLPMGERVFEAYGQMGDAMKTVTLPTGTRAVGIQLDCLGTHGTLHVTVPGGGGASIACSTTRGDGKGTIGLEDESQDFPASGEITVTTDARNTWSVAVTAGHEVFNS
jgi:hypothetical protein